MVSRRQVLAATVGCVAAAAGCQSTGDGADRATTARPETERSSSVHVDRVLARKAVTYESRLGSGGVFAADDRQYVVGTVRPGDGVDGAGFALVADDRSFEPGLSGPHGTADWTVAGHGTGSVRVPSTHEGRSFVAFDLQSPISAPDARITYAPTGDEWPLPEGARETLAARGPTFSLESLSVPNAVTPSDPLSVSLTVRNTSDVDGRFLAALYWPTTVHDDDESTVVERLVAAGESVEVDVDVDTAHAAAEDGTVTLTVHGHVTAERDVDVDALTTS